MKIKKLFEGLLTSTPFILTAAFVYKEGGYLAVLAIFGTAALLIIAVIAGVMLMVDE